MKKWKKANQKSSWPLKILQIFSTNWNENFSLKFEQKFEGPGLIFEILQYQNYFEADAPFLIAQAGQFSIIHFSLTKYIHLSHPKYRCREGTTENLNICRKKCELEFFIKKCGCKPIAYRHFQLQSQNICEVQHLINCTYHFDEIEIESVNECRSGCLPPCIKWTYQATHSSLPYLIGENASEIEKEWRLKANIQLYFSNLEYTQHVEFHTMTFEQLVGSIGGLIGLYLGGSMLALIHILFTAIGNKNNVWKK